MVDLTDILVGYAGKVLVCHSFSIFSPIWWSILSGLTLSEYLSSILNLFLYNISYSYTIVECLIVMLMLSITVEMLLCAKWHFLLPYFLRFCQVVIFPFLDCRFYFWWFERAKRAKTPKIKATVQERKYHYDKIYMTKACNQGIKNIILHQNSISTAAESINITMRHSTIV